MSASEEHPEKPLLEAGETTGPDDGEGNPEGPPVTAAVTDVADAEAPPTDCVTDVSLGSNEDQNEASVEIMPNDKIQWMWGDSPGLLGQTVASKNPLRWSSVKNPMDTIAELAKVSAKGAERPVLVEIQRDGSLLRDQATFPTVAEAMAALKPQARAEQDDVVGELPAQGTDSEAARASAATNKRSSWFTSGKTKLLDAKDKAADTASKGASMAGGGFRAAVGKSSERATAAKGFFGNMLQKAKPPTTKFTNMFRPSKRGGDLESAPLKENASGKDESPGDDIKTRASLSHSAFVVDNKGNITDFYDIDRKKIGEGSYGFVSKATNKQSKAVRAVKVVAKATADSKKLTREVEIHKAMDHPNIVRLYESFSDFRNLYFVMELAPGKELFDHVIDQGQFTEKNAAWVMRMIFRPVFYMHECHYCHRDLKPENFIVKDGEIGSEDKLKLIDFGLASKCEQDQILKTKSGTPYYVAPQVLAGKYDTQCDIWSCGVIMYVLLAGYPPFFGETDAEVLNKVRLGNFSFNASDWKGKSEDSKNLIRMCLKLNPRDRYTGEQCLNHRWIKNLAPESNDVPIHESLVSNLRAFRSANQFKKAALHVIAHQLDTSSIKNLRDAFVALDENGDGLLTVAELRRGLEKGLADTPSDLEQIFAEVDTSSNGTIDYTEFIAATIDKKTSDQEDACWNAFRFFDRDGDGKISRAEIAQVLNGGDVSEFINEEKISEMMNEFDTDGDGQIDFDEFMRMMRGDTEDTQAAPVEDSGHGSHESGHDHEDGHGHEDHGHEEHGGHEGHESGHGHDESSCTEDHGHGEHVGHGGHESGHVHDETSCTEDHGHGEHSGHGGHESGHGHDVPSCAEDHGHGEQGSHGGHESGHEHDEKGCSEDHGHGEHGDHGAHESGQGPDEKSCAEDHGHGEHGGHGGHEGGHGHDETSCTEDHGHGEQVGHGGHESGHGHDEKSCAEDHGHEEHGGHEGGHGHDEAQPTPSQEAVVTEVAEAAAPETATAAADVVTTEAATDATVEATRSSDA